MIDFLERHFGELLIALIVVTFEDAWRVVGPLELPDAAYMTAAHLLNRSPRR
jgi:hypothetical protein